MATLHLTLKGEIGGRRAEVRLEPDAVRIQVLTVATQQTAVALTLPLRDLTELRIVRRVPWAYVVVPTAIASVAWWQANQGTGSASFEWLGKDVAYWFAPAVFLAVAAVMRRNILRIATQDASAEVDISPFSRRRARELVDAVRTVRTDLPA